MKDIGTRTCANFGGESNLFIQRRVHRVVRQLPGAFDPYHTKPFETSWLPTMSTAPLLQVSKPLIFGLESATLTARHSTEDRSKTDRPACPGRTKSLLCQRTNLSVMAALCCRARRSRSGAPELW